jgi:two-component system OmpR family response regulator
LHPNSNLSLSHLWTQRRVNVKAARLRVLVVDDNQNAAEALASYLTLQEMDCRIANGGFDAISAGVGWLPDVIVMDISMPVCDGFQAALALRRDSRTAGTAIIAFTALDETEVKRQLSGHEFDGYCQKGQSPNKLVALVLNFVR